MGVGDLHEERPRPVSPEEHAQHMSRLQSGHIMNGLRGHRLAWALVNGVLVSEASGKGFAVHRNVMRRLGGRVPWQIHGVVDTPTDERDVGATVEV